MCLIAFALGGTGPCPLLLASNRDEWWQRPTQPLDRWHSPVGTPIWAGRDAEAGGTWLGFSAHGRVAMLTNVRPRGPESAPRSRGELPLHWLDGPGHTPHWRDLVARTHPAAYNGFNLVLGDLHTATWVWLSNRPTAEAPQSSDLGLPTGWTGRSLGPGVYGLSNAHLDTPWPKTLALRAAVRAAHARLRTGPAPDGWHAPLLRQLLDARPAPDATADAWQRGLSSTFVHLPAHGYGTRSSLIARCSLGADGPALELQEWTHAVQSAPHAVPVASHWPLDASVQRRISINRWGMPTSS
ncbi:NRDE family protein [Aquabacterium sp. A08]|uniref:NRDE family protein n=1 Tax=Aquabacterium sp. A08 TaxID=2718532 RepID=UPI00141F3057|nr:NRDE family protein [Aquabacterium sp. A08]NIC40758.1 NRDE family protein [Aquabacterium sp. A08]NIC42196.1 NRDE family protein [Aquabacterium sp. A08]NIC43603.1 NRDE family protein [Aquabacterium sp. A08]